MKNNKISHESEDYLEAIFLLASKNRIARVKDIAVLMSVSMSTVTNALRRLSDKGLVNYNPYQSISLTDTGEDIAEKTLRKHQILTDFFVSILNVDDVKADETACKIEHNLDEEVVEKFLDFIKLSLKNNKSANDKIRFLNSIDIGEEVNILKISPESNEFGHLAKMGLLKGTKVKVINKNKKNLSIEINVRGYNFSLSNKEASLIEVKRYD